MRTDVTVQGPLGALDVAVLAPAGTRLRDVDAQLRSIAGVSSAGAWCSDDVLVEPDALIGHDVREGMSLATGAAPDRARGLLRLIVSCGADSGAFVDVSRGAVVAGRGVDCDLVLTDPSVSRRHMTMRIEARGVVVRDLGSANGTYVGDRPVVDATSVTTDDLIRVGDTVLRVSDGAARTPGTTAASQIEWPSAPAHTAPARISWVAAAIPLLVAGAMAVALRNVQLLLFMVVSPLAMSAAAVAERLRGRSARKLAAAQYAAAVIDANSALRDGLRAERRRRHAELPDVYALSGALSQRREHSSPACGPAVVRVGLGDAPAALTISRDGAGASAGVLDLVPIRVDLTRTALRIAGPRMIACELAYWVVLQLAARDDTSARDVVLRLHPQRAADWEWARWLPGVRYDANDASHQRRAGSSTSVIVDDGEACPPDPRGGRCDIEIRLAPNVADQLVTITPAGDSHRVVLRSSDGRVEYAISDRVPFSRAETMARQLCMAGDARMGVGVPPPSCRLLDVLGTDCATAGGVRARWARSGSRPPVAVGVGDAGPVVLDLARDGPHALVAGTTGSGKSEFLQTWVMSLAVAYPPDELSFVLVDYKGGAAFAECSALPHVGALVTDLDAGGTQRMLASLDAELRRRERLFATARVADLDSYRATSPPQPLARLVVMIDEFAALVSEHADFVSGLVAVAQRGRSLGIHLVLATQRPGGVVSPEIRANASLRIALRMTDAGESRDVVGDSSAAEFGSDAPGRAVVSSASGRAVFQVATVSGRFDLRDEALVAPLGPWRTLEHDDRTRTAPTDRQALVDAITDAARIERRAPAQCPWLPPLPTALALDDLPQPVDAWHVPIALADHPTEQRRETIAVDLASGEAVGIAGSARSGRTTALVSITVAACSRLPPDDCAVYLLDGSSGGLQVLEAMPHVATHATWRDVEHLARLVRRLAAEVTRRRSHLRDLRCDSVRQARERGADIALALVVIDGWDGCVRVLDDYDAGESSAALLGLVRAGPSVGMSVVVSGDREMLAVRLAASLTSRYALRLADRGDYALVGVTPSAVPGDLPPGRAVRAADGVVLQFAHAGPSAGAEGGRHAAASVAASSSPPTDRDQPRLVVRSLPVRIDASHLPPRPGQLVLGVGGDAAEPIWIQLQPTTRMIVAGPPGSGRTSVVRLLAEQAWRAGVRVVVLAAEHSPAIAFAHGLRIPVLTPSSEPDAAIADAQLVLVDDAETFAGTPAEHALLAPTCPSAVRPAIVATTSNTELALAHRNLVAELRRSRRGLLLCPRASDGEPFGIRLPRRNGDLLPGRGLLIGGLNAGDQQTSDAIPIHVASADVVTTCAGNGDRSAGRTSP